MAVHDGARGCKGVQRVQVGTVRMQGECNGDAGSSAFPCILIPALPSQQQPNQQHPRQTIADQGRPWQTKAFWNPRCYQHLRCLYCLKYKIQSTEYKIKGNIPVVLWKDYHISYKIKNTKYKRKTWVVLWTDYHIKYKIQQEDLSSIVIKFWRLVWDY